MATAAESPPLGNRVRRGMPLVAAAVLALAHLAALVAFPGGFELGELAILEAAALTVIVGTALLTGESVADALFGGLVFLALAAGTWTLLESGTSLLVTALVLGGGVALLSYGLHRYELVALGLVAEDVDTETDANAEGEQ